MGQGLVRTLPGRAALPRWTRPPYREMRLSSAGTTRSPTLALTVNRSNPSRKISVAGPSSHQATLCRFNFGTGHYTQVVWASTEELGCGMVYYQVRHDRVSQGDRNYSSLVAISNSSNSGGLSLTQSLSHVTQEDLWIRRSFITLRMKDFWIKYFLTRLTSGTSNIGK